jgi:hypothetical protein
MGERELIVMVKKSAGVRASARRVSSVTGTDVSPLANLLAAEGAAMEPLFGMHEDLQRAEAAELARAAVTPVPDLSVFYRVHAPDEKLEALAEQLRQLDFVDAAYVQPPPDVPRVRFGIREVLPSPAPAPAATPDFTSRQGYLGPAPVGIDARFAWTQAGGTGVGVNIIDCENAWNFNHEDLQTNKGGVVVGTAVGDNNHGTAVLGEFGGDNNGIGVTGICFDARVRAASFSLGVAATIKAAASSLSAGDILLLEVHIPGPNSTPPFVGSPGDGQVGYIACEFWEANFQAIQFAVARGVIVVEAAGNGRQNLDDPIYNTPPPGSPPTWTNPFNRTNRDSGAIVVGAGDPPPGTHGRNSDSLGFNETYVDRARCGFSNFGSVVDCQGWGFEVTSTGYGDLQGGADPNRFYTDVFSGTSSASPIVVGAIGCVQGILRNRSLPLLTPASARSFLRSSGSAQQDAPGRPSTQRIGNRPDLKQLIPLATGGGTITTGHAPQPEFFPVPSDEVPMLPAPVAPLSVPAPQVSGPVAAVPPSRSNAVAIVGVVGIAAVMGMVATAGIVGAVAISKDNS